MGSCSPVDAGMRAALLGLALAAALGLAAAAEGDGDADVVVAQASGDGTKNQGFRQAFVESFGVILATEIGDRTFFIAAIMAMRNARVLVWSGAVAALALMTVIATLVGHVAPMLISRKYTQYAAAALFLYFGVRMLKDGLTMTHTGASEELEEVEAELAKKQEDGPDEEAGGDAVVARPPDSMNKVLMQAFTLTFIAEWGDRSQIATIALAAAREPFGVSIGAVIGHALCTGLAVVGGRLLASSISERTVLLVGGVLFVLFAVLAACGIGE